MPEVPGGAGTIVGALGVIVTAIGTYLGTRYTTRSQAQTTLTESARREVEMIFARHASELKDRDDRHDRELHDRDRRIEALEERVADLQMKNDFCEQRVHTLQLEVQQLKNQIERLARPWDGRERRGSD